VHCFFVKVLFFLGGEDVFLYICRTKQLKALEKELDEVLAQEIEHSLTSWN